MAAGIHPAGAVRLPVVGVLLRAHLPAVATVLLAAHLPAVATVLLAAHLPAGPEVHLVARLPVVAGVLLPVVAGVLLRAAPARRVMVLPVGRPPAVRDKLRLGTFLREALPAASRPGTYRLVFPRVEPLDTDLLVVQLLVVQLLVVDMVLLVVDMVLLAAPLATVLLVARLPVAVLLAAATAPRAAATVVLPVTVLPVASLPVASSRPSTRRRALLPRGADRGAAGLPPTPSASAGTRSWRTFKASRCPSRCCSWSSPLARPCPRGGSAWW